MRPHEIRHDESVLEAVHETSCPLCAFLKNTLAKLLQDAEQGQIDHLCNAHAWGIAPVGRAEAAAKIFLSLLDEQPALPDIPPRECTICLRLHGAERRGLEEIAAHFQEGQVISWLKHGVVCQPHAAKLKAGAPIRAQGLIDYALNKRRAEICVAIEGFLAETSQRGREHAGILGRAAEYLFAQRGVPMK